MDTSPAPKSALLRAPGPELAACELTHVAREPIDVERALEQHAALARTLESLGLDVEVLPPFAGFADAAFVEDTAVVLDDVCVLGRPGTTSRLGEVAAIEPVLATRRALERTEAPHTLEGGDVLTIDDVLYVGLSERTTHGGMKALAHTLLGYRYRIKALYVRGCLHLKTACTHLGGETLLVNPDWFDRDRLSEFEMVPVEEREPFGANALRVGETLVCSSAYPRTIERIQARGFDVRVVDVSEFHKAEAGLTCLCLLFA
ncbi:MAG: dimethylargininase [bacterium]|nr:dimethylargininase [bacterium]